MIPLDHDRRQYWDAIAAYADHQLIEKTIWPGGGRCRIGRLHPDGSVSSVYLTEVVMSLGRIVIHGDIDTFAFRGYRGELASALWWICERPPWDEYVQEKAFAGRATEPEKYDERRAVVDLGELEERARDEFRSSRRDQLLEAITEARHAEGRHEQLHALYHGGWDSEYLYRFGMGPNPQLAFAMAAMNKCAALLREEEQ